MSDKFEQEVDNLLDNFDVKPITTGLGFHHSLKDQKEIKTDLKAQSKLLKSEFETRVSNLKRSSETSKAVDMGELAPFYTDQSDLIAREIKETMVISEPDEDKVEIVEAGIGIRFTAWAIDVAILASFLLITFAFVAYFLEFSLSFIRDLYNYGDLKTSLAVMGLMYYVFYFSFLDKTDFSSIGKNLLGLKLYSENGKRISLFKSITRTLFSLISIPTLGIPVLLGLQDQLFSIKVTKR